MHLSGNTSGSSSVPVRVVTIYFNSILIIIHASLQALDVSKGIIFGKIVWFLTSSVKALSLPIARCISLSQFLYKGIHPFIQYLNYKNKRLFFRLSEPAKQLRNANKKISVDHVVLL